jgi:homoserine dehydrogenase
MLRFAFVAVLAPCTAAWSVGQRVAAVPYRASAATMAASDGPLRIGIVGGGTVGGGIVEILQRKADSLKKSIDVTVDVKKIVVRDASKPRDFDVPSCCEITDSVSTVIDDPDIDLVVEVMGGTTLAKEVVTKSLKAGKHVVTANKALIAQDLPEIEALVKEINAKSEKPISFGYEAAVCGGIPVIHTMQTDFLGDDVTQLSGIINGCTNFILSNMASSGMSYTDALSEASELGYAEADPTLDVGGFDARSKLKILIKLAFGLDVEEDEIPCRGITEVSSIDFEYANTLGGTVKLLGVAKLVGDGGDRISAFVAPCFVPSSNTLATINGATNALQVSSASLKESVFVGQGAGRYPTANSCVSDILAIAQGKCGTPFPKLPSKPLSFVNSFSSSFYVRIRYRDQVGITAELGQIFQQEGASIYSMLQNPINNRKDAQFVVITDPVDISKIKAACVKVEATDWCLGSTFYMPVL